MNRKLLAIAVALAAAIAGGFLAGRSSDDNSSFSGFGYRGGVRVGVAIRIGDKLIADNTRLSQVIARDAKVEIQSNLGKLNCENQPPELICPSPDAVAVRFWVSALLDLRFPIDVGGKRVATIVRHGSGPNYAKQSLGLPALSPGRHCVLVSALENSNDVIAEQFSQHGIVALWPFVIGESEKPNHCQARSNSAPGASQLTLDSGPFCSYPLLSKTPHQLYINRRMKFGLPLWAMIPKCSERDTAVFWRDGALLGEKDALPPLAIPSEIKEPGWLVPLRRLPVGAWHLVMVQDGKGGDGKEGFGTAWSEPVLIQELP